MPASASKTGTGPTKVLLRCRCEAQTTVLFNGLCLVCMRIWLTGASAEELAAHLRQSKAVVVQDVGGDGDAIPTV